MYSFFRAKHSNQPKKEKVYESKLQLSNGSELETQFSYRMDPMLIFPNHKTKRNTTKTQKRVI